VLLSHLSDYKNNDLIYNGELRIEVPNKRVCEILNDLFNKENQIINEKYVKKIK
jgi:hypothetical protein